MSDRPESRHWSEDPFWTEALDEYRRLRESGQTRIELNLEAVEECIFRGDGPAYRLMEGMCSVQEHEGMEGCRGAPRLVLALLACLYLSHKRPLKEVDGRQARRGGLPADRS
jgi:hypothetical protein